MAPHNPCGALPEPHLLKFSDISIFRPDAFCQASKTASAQFLLPFLKRKTATSNMVSFCIGLSTPDRRRKAPFSPEKVTHLRLVKTY
jgi:hypothetical protein